MIERDEKVVRYDRAASLAEIRPAWLVRQLASDARRWPRSAKLVRDTGTLKNRHQSPHSTRNRATSSSSRGTST